MEEIIGILFFVLFIVVPAIAKFFKSGEDGSKEDVGLEARLEEAIRQAKEEVERRKREAASQRPPRVEPIAGAPRQAAAAPTSQAPQAPRPIATPPRPAPTAPRPIATVPRPAPPRPAAPPPPPRPMARPPEPPAFPPAPMPTMEPIAAMAPSPKQSVAPIKGPAAPRRQPLGGLSLGRSELRRMTLYREILGPPRAMNPRGAGAGPHR